MLISYSAATMTGQEPFFNKDATIEQASEAANPFDLPDTIHSAVTAQQFCSKVHRAMTEFETLPKPASPLSRISAMEALERDFQVLEIQLANTKHGKSTLLYHERV